MNNSLNSSLTLDMVLELRTNSAANALSQIIENHFVGMSYNLVHEVVHRTILFNCDIDNLRSYINDLIGDDMIIGCLFNLNKAIYDKSLLIKNPIVIENTAISPYHRTKFQLNLDRFTKNHNTIIRVFKDIYNNRITKNFKYTDVAFIFDECVDFDSTKQYLYKIDNFILLFTLKKDLDGVVCIDKFNIVEQKELYITIDDIESTMISISISDLNFELTYSVIGDVYKLTDAIDCFNFISLSSDSIFIKSNDGLTKYVLINKLDSETQLIYKYKKDSIINIDFI